MIFTAPLKLFFAVVCFGLIICQNIAEPEDGLLNKGEDCWSHCSRKQGPCAWCGSGGYCCTRKFGWTDISNGCDGTFGGQTKHECSKPRKTCNPNGNRINCPGDFPGMSKADCMGLYNGGCCWDQSISGVPWCFKQEDARAAGKQCDDDWDCSGDKYCHYKRKNCQEPSNWCMLTAQQTTCLSIQTLSTTIGLFACDPNERDCQNQFKKFETAVKSACDVAVTQICDPCKCPENYGKPVCRKFGKKKC